MVEKLLEAARRACRDLMFDAKGVRIDEAAGLQMVEVVRILLLRATVLQILRLRVDMLVWVYRSRVWELSSV